MLVKIVITSAKVEKLIWRDSDMKKIFRWHGEENDTVKLEEIKKIPVVS